MAAQAGKSEILTSPCFSGLLSFLHARSRVREAL
jgi:hypothetical protein